MTVDKSTPPEKASTEEGFLSLRIDLPTRERLERLAKKNERSLAGEIRLALRRHLEAAA